MGESEQKAIKAFINSRQELAMLKLAANPKYQEVCRQLEVSGETADAILNMLEKDERVAVRYHYEETVHKSGYEHDEMYLQGFRDCLSAMVFFGVLRPNG